MIPYRQIRALHDDHYITVYQAYSDSIADAALREQRLNASPDFRPSRMTWIKPSWCWMMYRSGYSRKDPRQSRILAIRMRRPDFDALLAGAVLSNHGLPPSGDNVEGDGGTHTGAGASRACGRARACSTNIKTAVVRVQWDPERTARLEKLPHRSIQIGIPGCSSATWAGEGIVSIEDVTARARELQRVLYEEPEIGDDELVRRGLLPHELPYHPVCDGGTSSRIGMTVSDSG